MEILEFKSGIFKKVVKKVVKKGSLISIFDFRDFSTEHQFPVEQFLKGFCNIFPLLALLDVLMHPEVRINLNTEQGKMKGFFVLNLHCVKGFQHVRKPQGVFDGFAQKEHFFRDVFRVATNVLFACDQPEVFLEILFSKDSNIAVYVLNSCFESLQF